MAGPASAQPDPGDDPNEYANTDVFTTPVISEFMASNGSNEPLEEGELLDEDGESSDWIEIYNPTAEAVHLGGWYLTNDADNLEQWKFPAGVVLNPGQFLIVFASGKNRTAANAELHTNFRLNIDGEYLALVEADGETIAHEYGPKFPKQLSDVSYGLGQYATALIPPGARASYHIPTAGDEGKDWTALGFDDSAWKTGPTGIGFGTTAPGFEVIYYKANTAVSDLDTAELVIDNPSLQSTVASETAPVINYLNTSGNGHFDADNPFPSTTIGANVEDFVILATGKVLIPQAGDWTFGVNSDDGFGVEMTNGTNVLSFSYPAPRSASDTIVTFNVPDWGFYDLRLVYYERGGGSALEFFAAQGRHSSFNSSRFRLLGDMANGGLYVMSSSDEANTNVEQQMKNVNASLWTRIEFEGDQTAFFDSLALRMKYEDAFLAYLNGVEIARSNFTGAPGWNSAADGDRPNELASGFDHFDISDLTVDLREGTNVLAIHGLNDNKTDGEFLILPELIAASNRMVPQYFTTATPEQFNVSGAMNIVADTQFSVDRGFYDMPFDVAITCDTPGVTIHYTLDGSAPSEVHGNEFFIPIRISTTTCLRAMAFRPGWMSTNVDTQTYIFLNQVARQPNRPFGFPDKWGSTTADYEMDPDVVNDSQYRDRIRNSLLSLPTMSIVTETDNVFGPGGIYSNSSSAGVAWERPASVEYFFPDGTTGFQVNAGLRIYGGNPFRGMNLTRKKSFRLLFKRQYGPTKLNYRLFDAPDAAARFDTIVLRAGSNDGWNNYGGGGTNVQYILDEFMHRFQLETGQVSPHGTFVHLYINGLYWGLYHPTERPMASFCANYYGGDKEEWDALNSGTPTGESNQTTWNAMLSQVSGGLADTESYQKIQGNNPDGTNNPAYDDLLDVENYIDWMFTNFWGGTGDWPNHNFFVGCRRPPNATGFKFFNWDSEGVIVVWSSLNVNRTGVSSNGARPYVTLRDNEEFRLLFADHTYRHMFNGGPGTTEVSYARYKELADQVELAIIAESARWGDQARNRPYTLDEWQNSRDYILGTYMQRRPAIVLGQLRNAGLYPSIDPPVFNINGQPQHGGQIPSTHVLSMTAPLGTIYYSTDGNDPRLPTQQNIISDVTLVEENTTKRAIVPSGPISSNWRGGGTFNDSSWTLVTGSPGGIGYERSSGYQNYISLDLEAQMYNGNTSCYIRIPFTADPALVPGFNFMRLRIRYDDGFVAYLNGTEVARRTFTGTPAWNSSSNSNHEAPANLESIDISAYTDSLKQGSNILAIQGLNTSRTSSDMLISCKLEAGESSPVGDFLSDSAIRYAGPIQLAESTAFKTRLLNGAVWSALSEVTFAVGPVADNLRITEIMYNPQNTGNPDDPNKEFIELKNIGTETLNLNLVRFTNGIDFTFPSLELSAGEYVVVVKDIEAFSARYGIDLKIAGEYSGSLNNGGERIELQDALGQSILNFRYSDNWYDITDGMDFSLTIEDPTAADPNQWDDKSAWRPSAEAGGSPGWDDTGELPALGEVVINELLAHSHAGAPDWIELHNTSDTAINIGGWFLSDSSIDFMKYEIAAGTTIEPYDYIVFYEDLHFGNPDDPGCHVPFALSENGETLYLHSGSGGVLTGYNDQEKFDASETGVAFGRYQKSSGTYNFVAMSVNTPGGANAYPKVGPVVINEIMYNPSSGNQDQEYIELLNISDSAITLAEYDNELFIDVPWRFADDSSGIIFDFPLGTTMAPGEYLLLVKNITAFNAAYPFAAGDVQIFEWGPGRLSNAGEKLQLSKPGDQVEEKRYYIRVDRVNYSDGFHPLGDDPWPLEPDGYGKSLIRIVPANYGNDSDNWTAADHSPGQ